MKATQEEWKRNERCRYGQNFLELKKEFLDVASKLRE